MKTSFTIKKVHYLADHIICDIELHEGNIKIGQMYSRVDGLQRHIIVTGVERMNEHLQISIKKSDIAVDDTYGN